MKNNLHPDVSDKYNSHLSNSDVASVFVQGVKPGIISPDNDLQSLSQSEKKQSGSVKLSITSFQYPIEYNLGGALQSSSEEYEDEEFMEEDEYSSIPDDYEDAALRLLSLSESGAYDSTGKYEITTTAQYSEENGRVTIMYSESELTGMEGTQTSVTFDLHSPEIVAILRSGTVKSAFILEEGKRHTTVYETSLIPFEICIYSRRVVNTIHDMGGEIYIDYIVEIKGMSAQHTRLKFKLG